MTKQELKTVRTKLINTMFDPKQGRDRQWLSRLFGCSIRTVSNALAEKNKGDSQ
jgi:transcriptional antiterminator